MTYNQSFLKNYPLPSSMEFSFDVSSLNIPRGFATETPKKEDKKDGKKAKLTRGRVIVTYKEYKVNKGLNDSLFMEEKK
ncbi:MAG: hypothetical protein IT279_03260 [Ignavibacteriaceae bacterium]|nr:hypothetical protein [Ignavibacteriaceae bacterium]